MQTRSALRLAALASALLASAAWSQTSRIKFQLDWRFEGPAALFLLPAAKGYYKDAKLDVTIDPGNGSAGAVTRVASGTYDMGIADISALMEFHANNPDAPNKPVAVMIMYNSMPAAVVALKKSGIRTPKDLSGKKIGAPVFDSGRKAFPIFAKVNNVTGVQWISMDPPLRETMLARGDVDAITGFPLSLVLNLEVRGVRADELVVMPYSEYGVKLYGSAIIASPKLIKENPAAIKAFLQATTRGMKEAMADPGGAVDYVKQRDGIINVDLETRRLKMAINGGVNSTDARAEGFGQVNPQRLAQMANLITETFATKTRVNPALVWNGSFLPSAAELNILPVKK